jgi:hypothetical protein
MTFRALLTVVLLLANLPMCMLRSGDGTTSIKSFDKKSVIFTDLADYKDSGAPKNDSAKPDSLPTGVFVIQKPQAPTAMLDLFLQAQRVYQAERREGALVRVPRKPLIIVGHLPGDGRGSNASYSTEIGLVRDFLLTDHTIFLLASCKFTGPHIDGEPAPQAFYFSADMPVLGPGKYTIFVRVSPEGSVFEQWEQNHEYGRLPDFGVLKCDFEVSEK